MLINGSVLDLYTLKSKGNCRKAKPAKRKVLYMGTLRDLDLGI